jgi:hypothetical protein
MRRLDVGVLLFALGLLVSACGSSLQKPTDGGADSAPRKVDCSGDCQFVYTYTVSTDGFFAYAADKMVLSPSQSYEHQAYFFGDGGNGSLQTVTCAPAVPSCTSGGPVSVCDIAQDLDDEVVQAALAQSPPPFFGPDSRPVDGSAFSFMRDDGHGFEEGDGTCASPTCVPVPAAIARLKADLEALDGALILSPECTALNVPLKTAGSG